MLHNRDKEEATLKLEKGELFKQSTENLEWFRENYEDLKRKYDNQWIVIQKKKVVGKSSTYDKIVEILKKEDQKNAIVEFIDSKQIAMFF